MANLTSVKDDSDVQFDNLNLKSSAVRSSDIEFSSLMHYCDDSSSMLDGSDSDSETPSISLPSLPVSLQQKSGLTKSISVTSMKEFDQKLNDLRTENFDLKLRLYFAQKGKNGVTNPGLEQMVTEELLKKEKKVKSLEKQLEEKDDEIKVIRHKYEHQLREKDKMIVQLKKERDEALIHNLNSQFSRSEDLQELLEKIQRLKSQKELMEKAISKQLKKTDLLLKKASPFCT